jgi:hypothetical protein
MAHTNEQPGHRPACPHSRTARPLHKEHHVTRTGYTKAPTSLHRLACTRPPTQRNHVTRTGPHPHRTSHHLLTYSQASLPAQPAQPAAQRTPRDPHWLHQGTNQPTPTRTGCSRCPKKVRRQTHTAAPTTGHDDTHASGDYYNRHPALIQ